MQFRVVTNGNYFRAQVRTLFFWWDIDGNGYRSWEPYEVCYESVARGFIRKFPRAKGTVQVAFRTVASSILDHAHRREITLILGFTGTRHGMTEPQREAVAEFLRQHRPTETHSGDCKGADVEFLDSALLCNNNDPPRTHGHPCDIEKWRAYRRYDHLHPVKSPAARNQDIVNDSDELLAAPQTTARQPHSGTWQTMEMAKAAKKFVTIVWPDGSITKEGPNGYIHTSATE